MTESDMTGSKLVLIDIDGTLADEDYIVSESAKTACVQAQANGHKLFTCTSQSVLKIECNILDPGLDDVVSIAGAQANVGDKLLSQHLVSPEAIDAAMVYFTEHHIESYQQQGVDGMYIPEGYRRYLKSKGEMWNHDEFARLWHLLDEVEVPAGSTLGYMIHVSKGPYFTGSESGASLENTQYDLASWLELVHGLYDEILSSNGELLINDIDRGTAVRDVAPLFGYAIADTIAIGDSDNDTVMLKVAGTSVAMGNVIYGIQVFCDLTTTDIHQDGLANALKTLGLV